MNCLELFSGTHSVGKVLQSKGYNVVSVDLSGATINTDILEWDYTTFPRDYFYYIHASPPCNTFSQCKRSWIGRKLKSHGDEIITKDHIIEDQLTIGLPLLNKTLEILDYFNPKYYTIENPQTGDMKKYLTEKPFTDVDYCRYGFPYKKRTRIWNNFNFEGKLCDKNCGSFVNGKHIRNCGHYNKNFTANIENFKTLSVKEKYRIPPSLIEEWLFKMGI